MNESLWKLYTKEDTKGMRSLIEHGANPNCYGLIKKALLHKAAESGKVQMAKVLLENGANPNIKDLYQRTPLHFAAENGHTDVVRLLLEHKADVSAADMKGVNALILAANIDIVELLISNGIDIKSTDKDGQIALHIAASKGKCDIVKTLLKHGADHSAKDNKGNTPIVYAINNGHNDVVKALIDAGVNVNERVLFYGHDSTLLHHAVETKNVEIVKTLLDHGHPVNAVDHGKWAAFDSACVAGLPDIVELMLERGANVDHVVGVMKRVSLHHAVDSESSNLKVVELLLKHSDVNVQDEV
jgi:ankyrin repeat protein